MDSSTVGTRDCIFRKKSNPLLRRQLGGNGESSLETGVHEGRTSGS